jgi:hypothetical protein
MPVEQSWQVPVGREVYRFRPWYERPLSEREMRGLLVAVVGWTVGLFVAAAVVLAVLGVWLAVPVALAGPGAVVALAREGGAR